MRRVFRIPFGRTHIAREVDDELAFHLEMRVQRLIAAGASPDDARREALRQFGDVASVRDSCVAMDQEREHTMRRTITLAELRQDIAFALRTLRRNLGFTTVVVSALALGIGANTAIFTLVNAVVVRTLPVSHPEQLVEVGNPARTGSLSQGSPRTDLMSYPLYKDLVAQNRVFTGILASGRTDRLDVNIDDRQGEFEHPRGRFVSGNYFSLLGVPAERGRTFDSTADLVPGSSPVVVISDGYWTRRFHRDPSAIGRTIVMDGLKFTIIGVAAPSYTGEIVGAVTDVWVPLSMEDAMRPHLRMLDDRGSCWLLLLGRLRPGATLDQAKLEMKALIERNIVANAKGRGGLAYLADNPKYFIDSGARGFSRTRFLFEAPLLTLMIGVALLLCIICANVANLMMARAAARGREMAVRVALGADRARVARQLLTESAVLAALSAAVGMLVAWWGSRALLTLAAQRAGILDLSIDAHVLGFTLAVSVLAVALFGLAPALRASRVDLASTMRANAAAVTGGTLGGGRRVNFGKLLIVAQVALSIILLVGAAMLVRSLRNLERVDVGLDRDHLVLADLDINAKGYAGAPLANAVHALVARIAAIPGVAAVTFSENGIFSGTNSNTSIQLPGFTMRTSDDSSVAYDQVGPGYVHAIGAHLLAGRDFEASDEQHQARDVIVNESFAKFYFPNGTAVGKYLSVNDTVPLRIIGVVADTRDQSLETAPERRMYYSYLHASDPGNQGDPGSLRVIVRSSGDPAALVQQIRRAVATVDPTLPIDDVSTLAESMHDSIQQERMLAQLATAFGVLALVLAAIGLYGVMTYAVTRRTGEIGLRVALGAQRGNVIGMVMSDAMKLVVAGVIVGLPVAIGAARVLEAQLHGVPAADPLSIVVAVAVLSASAVAAVLVPAMRASRVSPIVALRAD